MPLLSAAVCSKARSSSLFIQRRSTLLAHPHLAIAANLVSDANRPAGRTDQLHVRNRDAAFLFSNAALDMALWVRPHVLLHHHHVLDQYLRIYREYAQNATLLPFVSARADLHGIDATDLHSHLSGNRFLCRY